MISQEDFDLETVLSILTGINCTDDFTSVYELYWYMFEDQTINDIGIIRLHDIAKNHILRIHPELKSVKYDKTKDLNEWINDQKAKFGNEITMCIIGEHLITLNKKPIVSNR